MSMTSRRTIPVFALLLGACSAAGDPGGRIIAPFATVNNGEGVELAVQGDGIVDLPPPFGDMTYQFVAKRRADGTVTGHFSFTRQNPDGLIEFRGDVTCVTDDPNFPGRARVGGIVTENNSTSPGSLTTNHEVGDDVWFRLQDDVGGDTFQSLTTLGFKPTLVNTSAEYCALPFTGTHNGANVWNPASIFPLAEGQLKLNN